MAHELRSDESGFTLIELLVVILIIGILAAIALPMFLSQQHKGDDVNAKGDARNLVSHIESCFTTTSDYQQCDTAAKLGTTGLPIGTAAGQVEIQASAPTSFTVIAHSRSGNDFTLTKVNGGPPDHTCTTAGRWGCHSDGSW